MCSHFIRLLVRMVKRIIITVNDSKESIGIDKKPKRSMYSSVHETPLLQGCMPSGMMPVYNRLWYAAVSQPVIARGKAYFTTPLSNGNSPTARIMTRGNRKILWYQHKTQGANSMT